MHWCHQCEQRIVATPQLSCPNCNSEFIEELEGDPMDIAGVNPATATPAQMFQNVTITANPLPGRRPAVIFQQVGRPNPNRMPFPPFPFSFPFNPPQQMQVNAVGVDAAGNPDLFGQLMSQITQALNGAATNRQNANLPPGANVLPFGNLFNAMLGLNLQQDIFSSDMENLLNHLFETARCQGPPPASADYVSKMPVVKLADKAQIDELGTSCSVCYDEFELEQEVIPLPCKHAFHSGCILQWLKTSNTCPVCRYELPTDDKDYEQRKASQNNANRPSAPSEQTQPSIITSEPDVSPPPPPGMYS